MLRVSKLLAAGSFQAGDLPKNFWAVINITNKLEVELGQHELHGVKGISASPTIMKIFLPGRGGFLRLPGGPTAKLNGLTRVMYNNPDYFISNNFSAWKRVRGNSNFEDEPGFMELAERCHGPMGYPMNYKVMNAFKLFLANETGGLKVNTCNEFIKIVTKAIKAWNLACAREGREEEVISDTPQELRMALTALLTSLHRLYGRENEWILKDSILRIPKGSHLGIILNRHASIKEAYGFYDRIIAEYGTLQNAELQYKPQVLAYCHSIELAEKLKKELAGYMTVGVVSQENFEERNSTKTITHYQKGYHGAPV